MGYYVGVDSGRHLALGIIEPIECGHVRYVASLMISSAEKNHWLVRALLREVFTGAVHVGFESIDQVYTRKGIGADMATHIMKSQELVMLGKEIAASCTKKSGSMFSDPDVPAPIVTEFTCAEWRKATCQSTGKKSTPTDKDVKQMLKIRLRGYPGGLTSHENDALGAAIFGPMKWKLEALKGKK